MLLHIINNNLSYSFPSPTQSCQHPSGLST